MVTRYRVDVCNKTGVITVWMQTEETPCGFVPIIAWAGMDGVREFAEMLLEFYSLRIRNIEELKKTSDYIIRQAIGDNYFYEGKCNEQENNM